MKKYIVLLALLIASQLHSTSEMTKLSINEKQIESIGITKKQFQEYLDDFLTNIYKPNKSPNLGGMESADCFSLYLILKLVQPTLVVESGVFKGESTKIIRQTLGEDAIILCVDPRGPESYIGLYNDNRIFLDDNPNTTYFTDNDFIDFAEIDTSLYNGHKVLAFFDDHVNAVTRLQQAKDKGLRHLFFNDNFPAKAGYDSHHTIEHLKSGYYTTTSLQSNLYPNKANSQLTYKDLRIQKYQIFPNMLPGIIQTRWGNFSCESFLSEIPSNQKYALFQKDRNSYRWNTYILLED